MVCVGISDDAPTPRRAGNDSFSTEPNFIKAMFRTRCYLSITILFLILFTLPARASVPNGRLPRSTPGSGRSFRHGILRFLDEAEASSDHEMHSFMMLRHGKVIAEGWWSPYTSEYKHLLYSVSKTFTALAVGCAVGEGLISVEDRVITFFPELLPDSISPALSRLTVKHLLTMTTVHDGDPTPRIIPRDEDWVKLFLNEKLVMEPGTGGQYNSIASHTLAAIVEKMTGMPLINYLEAKLFRPLHISRFDSEVSPTGIAAGGWGLRLQTESLAKAGQLMLQGGVWEGVRLLPETYLADAVAGPPGERDTDDDWLQGYGYQLWLNSVDGYRMDGAFGQLVVVLPSYDAVIVMTCEGHDTRKQMQWIWRNLLPAISPERLPQSRDTERLRQRLAGLALPLPRSGKAAFGRHPQNGKYRIAPNAKGIEQLEFDFSEDECLLKITAHGQTHFLPFASGRWHLSNTSYPIPATLPSVTMYKGLPDFTVAGAFAWKSKQELELDLHYVDGAHSYRFRCKFNGSQLRVRIWESPGRNDTSELTGEAVE